MARSVLTAIWLAHLATLGVGCSGSVFGPSGPTCGDASCQSGDPSPCLDGSCGNEPRDPCAAIECPTGQRCEDGRCLGDDPCAGVTCDEPGQVCDPRDGSCSSGSNDEDGDGFTIAAGDCDDGDATIHPGAVEICDGVDQDCDLEVDEDQPDLDGDGVDVCGFGDPDQADCDDGDGARYPGREEECNGIDDDCDLDVDEGLGTRSCSTGCGTGEATCNGGEWQCSVSDVCDCSEPGAVETELCGFCGRRERLCGDDLRWGELGECQGEGECEPRASDSQPCGSCGEQIRTCGETCLWGGWGTCVEGGECVPSTSETCATGCGSAGTRTCDGACTWGPCQAPAETCNGVDDDCDGQVDEGFGTEVLETSYTTLSGHHPVCDGSTERVGPSCNAAIHRLCSSLGCTVSGFGPIENSGDAAYVTCVTGAEVVATSYGALASHHATCDGTTSRIGGACNAAIGRFCASRGAVSGFGPIENSGDTAYVTCVSAAEVVVTTYSTLLTHHEACDGTTSRVGGACNAAISRFCAARGAATGFGPVENLGDDAYVVCVSR